MRIVSPFYDYAPKATDVLCFMGGGMGNTEWHETFFKVIRENPNEDLVLFYPYNPDIQDTVEQVAWEFKYLNNFQSSNYIFSMYFDKYSNQPVSMYELGRMCTLSKTYTVELRSGRELFKREIVQPGFTCVVSSHVEAPNLLDIKAQMELLGQDFDIRTPEEHAEEVLHTYEKIKYKRRISNGNN